MKTYFECFPCFIKQALWITQRLGLKDKERERILKLVLEELKGISLDSPPPVIARSIYKIIGEVSGQKDPFREEKKRSIELCKRHEDSLKKRVEFSSNPLLEAIKISIAGNIIDFGALQSFDLEAQIKGLDQKSFAVCDIEEFREHLKFADEILYIADNAGETVFDKILIERLNKGLNKKIFYATRSCPIINDATLEDARMSGLEEVSTVIESGSTTAGTVIEECNSQFRRLFDNSRMIISKGQGNFETLSDYEKPIFFLLNVKCQVVAKHLGCKEGDFVLSFAPKLPKI